VNIHEYLQIWSQANAEVLQQALGTAFKVEVESAEDAAGPPATEGVWLVFAVGEPITVNQAFWISPSDATSLGQAFMGETADPLASLTDDHRDAVAELFRQVAGSAALALKAKVGRECEVRFVGAAAPGWAPVARARFRLVAEGRPPLALHIQLDSDLAPPQALVAPPASVSNAVVPAAVPQPAAAAAAAGPEPAAAAALAANEPRNLSLLLDMQLEVAIRFGKRELPLREILELNAGSVIEFEQQIVDPVELLLDGKTIGRGEVVVVDGNYGLRMTEISTAQTRMNSMMR
jgi:flagellar motor switch protein FliN/FliY